MAGGKLIPWGWLLLVVGLATFFRFFRLDLAQSKSDEARALTLALSIVEGQGLPLWGIPSSVGLANPPLLAYLVAFPLFLARDPLVAMGFIGLLNVAAVGITFIFARRYFGLLAAVLGSSLFAVGLWPTTFSRFIWAQNLMPFFDAVALLSFYEAILGQRRPLFLAGRGVIVCRYRGRRGAGRGDDAFGEDGAGGADPERGEHPVLSGTATALPCLW